MLIVMILFISSTIVIADGEKRDCLSYEPATTNLSGQIILRDSYEPPGFGESPDRDEKRRNIILLLSSPICVAGGKWQDEPEYGVSEIQLALSEISHKQYERLRKHFDTKQLITVRGHLYHGYNGYHVTSVLLFADEIGLDNTIPIIIR